MEAERTPAERPVITLILAVLFVYGVVVAGHALTNRHEGPAVSVEADHAATSDHGAPSVETAPHLASVIPFLSLLAAIAIFPIWRWTAGWWESNWSRLLCALALALVTLAYYLVAHPRAGVPKALHVLEHAMLHEYIPFIILLFSLYTISGGIRITGDLTATPATNASFLAVGAVLANIIGTTGAAVLLVRPLLESNAERKKVQHTMVFFIFVVCNCGGCLLPIGDPPLFLGFLKGVPFFWTLQHLWWPWLITNAILIGVYFVMDSFYFYPRERPYDVQRDIQRQRSLRIDGLQPNGWLLLGVILSVVLLDPGKPFPGLVWHPWPFLREVAQLLLVATSLHWGSRQIRVDNRFNYHAIVEVAVLFIGIFICMQPALEILSVRGGSLGLDRPHEFFWLTGSLSSVLDNAPTYVVFFEAAAASPIFQGHSFPDLVASSGELAGQAQGFLQGVSLGAVFLGAMTYIGNGPNFMVRAIAERSAVPMPSFFAYVFFYSVPILIPVFFLVTMLIF